MQKFALFTLYILCIWGAYLCVRLAFASYLSPTVSSHLSGQRTIRIRCIIPKRERWTSLWSFGNMYTLYWRIPISVLLQPTLSGDHVKISKLVGAHIQFRFILHSVFSIHTDGWETITFSESSYFVHSVLLRSVSFVCRHTQSMPMKLSSEPSLLSSSSLSSRYTGSCVVVPYIIV